MARISGVELGQDGGWNTFQHLFREDTQQLPSDVQGLEHGAVLVVTLRRVERREKRMSNWRVNRQQADSLGR
jgi:hypothetical protein